jgi:type I site-specific restriction endonuclease
MGIFDYDEVITVYSLKQAVEDGVLVEIFKKVA